MLAHPLVLFASGFMTIVELLADKLPMLDTIWDAVHTFIRIPAGAALAAGVFGDAGSRGHAGRGIAGRNGHRNHPFLEGEYASGRQHLAGAVQQRLPYRSPKMRWWPAAAGWP